MADMDERSYEVTLGDLGLDDIDDEDMSGEDDDEWLRHVSLEDIILPDEGLVSWIMTLTLMTEWSTGGMSETALPGENRSP